MKTSIIVFALLASGLMSIQAQYQVVENGANYRVWQKTTIENGTNRIHRYTELGAGLYYTNSNGQWVESKEEIETYPGGAIARQGPYQVIFANNLNTAGAIDQQTPDGKRLRSSILGLAYYDRSTGKNVLIAQIQDSQGELISSNQVLYPDAFDGVVKADVRYTYKKCSFEQDVILRQQPPTPESLGLNSQFTEIEVLTEFINPPPASIVQEPVANNALPDEEIGWGAMRIGHGRAFDLGEPRNSRSHLAVRRQYVTAQGRNILVEGVPLQRIEAYLTSLPLQANAMTKMPMLATRTLMLPKTPSARAKAEPMKLASAAPSNKGFVLDYVELNTDQGDFTFQAGTTYYISGGVNIGGTAAFEAGTIIKCSETYGYISLSGSVVCDTTAYSNAVFTSENDDSVGEQMPWSSGNPQENCMFLMYNNDVDNVTLSDCRFAYGGCTITGNGTLNDVQFFQCYDCIVQAGGGGANLNVNNGLVSGCYIFCDGSVNCENVTFDNDFAAADSGASYFTNCIFSTMMNIVYDVYGSGPTWDGSNNGFDNYPGDSWAWFGANQFHDDTPYQSGPLGGYYLPSGSPFIDAGNATADTLGLYWWTTQTGAGTYEGTSTVDLGYHYPGVDANGNPISTLFPGVPDYISDANGNGLPDAWEMQTFGNLNQYASELDSQGNTLFYDYTNVIAFTLESTNTFVTTNLVAVQVSVSSGGPAQQAVLINSTNFAGATWTSYASSNLTVNLGSMAEGNYAVWVGLRNLPDNPNQTWQEIDFTIDTTPPVLVITNPIVASGAATTLGIPLVQVQGYACEDLTALTFDVSNATGVVTGQPGTVMQRYFDTNSWSFTTNYFQCFDIMLVTGLNLVTIHATDFAGNTTTSNLLLNLDFSTRTNLPAVQLTFPQDGLPVSGTSFTVDGFVDDPMAAISAQMVDTNGNTNVVRGVVERNGRFWVDNLPLAGGTNVLTLTVTDSAGHTGVTNIGVIQSAVTLAMTPVDPNLLWQSVVDVTGTISDSGYAVSVNGMAADVNGNSWSATNVPVTPGGVACFTALATAGGQTQAATKSSPPKPDSVNGASIIVQSDTQTMHTDTDADYNWWPDQTETGQQIAYTEDWDTGDMNQNWAALAGGAGSSKTTSQEDHSGWTGPPNGWVINAPIYSTNAWAFLFSPLDPVPYDYSSYLTFSSGSDAASLNTGLGYEHCDVQNPYSTTNHSWGNYGFTYCFCDEHITHNYSRTAQTTMMLLSGGRGLPGQQLLHVISGFVKHIPPPYLEVQPPYLDYWPNEGYTWFHYLPCLPNNSVHLLNDTLHDDPNYPGEGVLYYVTVVGAGPVPCTPTVTGDKFYTWQLYDAPHILVHQTVCPALTDTNLARQNLGVGEYVTFSGMPDGTSWSASAGGIITNWDGTILFTAPSNAPAGGTSATVKASIGGKSLTVGFSVVPPSGMDHAVITSTTYYPISVFLAGAAMRPAVWVAPTDVSFYRVQLMEVSTGTTNDATNVTGYFSNPYYFPQDYLIHSTAGHWVGLTSDNAFQDDAHLGPLDPPWLGGGGFTWIIPVEWKVGDNGQTNPMTGWSQVFSMDANGTVTITKFNLTVTRDTNNVIIPSL